MEAAAGDGGDSENTATAPGPLPGPLPGPTAENPLSYEDYILSDPNAVSTVAVLCGSARCPPYMRRPQETNIKIPGAGNDLSSLSDPASASESQTDELLALASAEKEKHEEARTRKVVPSAIVASVVAVAILIGVVLWLRKRKRKRKSQRSLQPPMFNGYHSNSSFSSLHSNSSSYPGTPGPIRLHSSTSLDALMSPFASSPHPPHTPSRAGHQGRQQEMVQMPPHSGPGSAAHHFAPTAASPPPPLPRRARSDRPHQHQHDRQHLAPPPPLPHRNISHHSLGRQVPAPPLPPRAHESPPALPLRDRSNTFSDIPADDLPPYVDPIEEAMAAAESSDGASSVAGLAPIAASAFASSQDHGRPQRQQDPPPYHAIDSTPGTRYG
ncbi:hypothetical protein FB645_004604 [Coemansia sp. IMI 203386]|nr:hypothetical protein FB645_004604 [Coemansia sp. IMI 203386]